MSLIDHLQASVGTEIDDADLLRAAIHTRLKYGTFTLVIAVDQITEELKLVVEFLNAHTSPGVDVLALEIDYARDGTVEILVPRTYGESAATIKTPPTGQLKLTVDDFVRLVDGLADSDARRVFGRLLEHGRERGHHFAPGTAGMSCWYVVDGVPTSTWAVWPNEMQPSVSISFGSLTAKASAPRVLRFLGRLKEQDVLAPHLANIDEGQLNKFPNVPVRGVLDQPGALDALLEAVDELVETGHH